MHKLAMKSILVGVLLAVATAPVSAELSKKMVRKVVNKEITKRAPGLGGQGLAGPAGPAGPQGDVGPPGSIGSAAVQRFVHVSAAGVVDEAQSFGVPQSAVTLTGGTYCFSGLSYVSMGIVTLDYLESTGTELAKFGRAGPGCEAFVRVFDRAGTPTQGGFYLMLY
ncbi:hypothetical protein BH20PSE1_BH20PSE1_08490 [soil metagenome]